jgi:hypothetical protein
MEFKFEMPFRKERPPRPPTLDEQLSRNNGYAIISGEIPEGLKGIELDKDDTGRPRRFVLIPNLSCFMMKNFRRFRSKKFRIEQLKEEGWSTTDGIYKKLIIHKQKPHEERARLQKEEVAKGNIITHELPPSPTTGAGKTRP